MEHTKVIKVIRIITTIAYVVIPVAYAFKLYKNWKKV